MDYNGGAAVEMPRVTMAYEIYHPPSGRTRRWGRRKDPGPRVPRWVAILLVILFGATVGTIGWDRAARFFRAGHKAAVTAPAAGTAVPQPARPEWQADTANALEDGVREASAGNITQAEVATDRAAAVVTGARFKGESAPPGFFETAIRQLDQIVAVHPENARLGEHAALMRIELAQFRSALEASPADSGQSKHVGIGAPRTIARDSLLDPKSLGGKILDATLMPASAEILEPPASRLFVDNVRVENLTIAGATQTLDGMHWKNVTFMGTRLRYEGGEVDLENVHFVRCKFGFTTDERGVRLANTIALGQTSLVIE